MMGNKDIIENEQNDIVALANSLKWLNSSENRQNVLLTLLRVISSYKDPKATRLSISSLSARLNCSVVLLRQSISNLLVLHRRISDSKFDVDGSCELLKKHGIDAELCDIINEYLNSIRQSSSLYSIQSAKPSQYPNLNSVSARTEINIATMALRDARSVLVRVRFVIDGLEKIVVLDEATLKRSCQQLQNALSVMLKL